jgi:methyl-accepting chemotaxis protein
VGLHDETVMKKWFYNRKLPFKILLVLILVITGIAAFIVLYFPKLYSEAALASLKDKSGTLARITAFSAASGLEFDDREAVRTVLEGLTVDEDVLNAVVFGKNGEPFASLKESPPIPAPREMRERSVTYKNASLYAYNPIGRGEQPSGSVGIVVSARRTASAVSHFRRLTLIVSAVILMLGTVFSFLLLAPMLSQVKKFHEQLPRFARGDLRVTFPVLFRDEIGTLLSSINETLSLFRSLVQNSQRTSEALLAESGGVSRMAEILQRAADSQKDSVRALTDLVTRTTGEIRSVSDQARKHEEFVLEASSSILEITAASEQIGQNTDSLGQLVRATNTSINGLIREIKTIDNDLAHVEEMIEGNAAGIQEVESNMKSVGENTVMALDMAAKFSANSEKGSTKVAEVTAHGDRVLEIMKETMEKMRALSESVQSIVAFLDFIQDVNEKTNLLSINAFIISAESGEKGRGFHVVAEQIRTLANQTRRSANEINDHVAKVIQRVRGVEKTLESGVEELITLQNQSHLAKEMLAEINSDAEKSTQAAQKTSRALSEQANGIRSITRASVEISAQIGRLAGNFRQWVTSSDEHLTKLEKVLDLSEHVRGSIDEQNRSGRLILQTVEELKEMSEALRSSSRKQLEAMENVSRQLGKIRDFADNILGKASDLTSASQKLQAEADRVKQDINRFTT